jgi:hypothetical protein
VEDADREAVDAECGGDFLDCGRERCEYGGSGVVSHDEFMGGKGELEDFSSFASSGAADMLLRCLG